MFGYRIASANEALVITGRKSKEDQFRIITGKGAFVFPFFSRTGRLSLDIRESQLDEPCVTKQGIQIGVQAVSVFKVADDYQSISNAARRFMDQQRGMENTVGQVLAGHLRSIVGGMTVEQIIGDRNALAQQVKDSSSDEMEKMGLTIDSFQIREIEDPSNYIGSYAAPHLAAVQRDARIAAADADQAATEKEQAVVAAKAAFTRDAQIAQAEADGKAQGAKAQADQQGPLAQVQAQQAVAEQNAVLAQKQAEVTQATLESQVRKPADAEAYKAQKQAEGEAAAAKARAEAAKFTQVTAAEAERDATRARAEAAAAQAEQISVVAKAEAEATKVKNDALASGNLERQVATELVKVMPEVVKGIASGLANSNLTILNGAEGMGEVFAQIISQGRTLYDAFVKDTVRPQVAGPNGATPAERVYEHLDELSTRG